jgi:hypothetical protein
MKRISVIVLALTILSMGIGCAKEKSISSFFSKDKGNIEVTVQSCAGLICSSIVATNEGKYQDVQSITVRTNGDSNRFVLVSYPGLNLLNPIEVRAGDEYTFKVKSKPKSKIPIVITEVEGSNTIPITQFTAFSM